LRKVQEGTMEGCCEFQGLVATDTESCNEPDKVFSLETKIPPKFKKKPVSILKILRKY
jgi:hypothetical protein